MIVVDANVCLFFFVMSERTELARSVYERDSDWIAPEILLHEFVNVLSTWGKNRLFRLSDLLKTWRQAENLFENCLVRTDMVDVLSLAIERRISVYDAEYVAVARLHDIELVTEDKELLGKFPGTALSMADYLKRANPPSFSPKDPDLH